MTLSGATITWHGVTLHGSRAGGPYTLSTLEGWEELPDSRRLAVNRPAAHGLMGSAPMSDARVIRATGSCRGGEQRDALVAALRAAFTYADPGARPEELTVYLSGRTLTADAYLTRFRVVVGGGWADGHFRWQAEWEADDPLRYGTPISASCTFPARLGGLVYPLFPDGVLDYGVPSSTGRLTLTNSGDAAAVVQHEVLGPVEAAGFEIVHVGTGARLAYEGAVADGSRVLLDGATGAAMVDGVSDRGDLLTWRDWTMVPAGGSAEYAFVPRGSTSAAVLTSTIRPPHW